MEEPDDRKKVVFDTGTVLQATLSDAGSAFQSLRLLDVEAIAVFLSPALRAEYEDVLTRPAIREKNPHLTEERAQAVLERFDAKAQRVTLLRRYVEYPRDPDDEHVVNLAIHVRADYLVCRDKDLLDLARSRDFRLLYPFLHIVDPLAFLQAMQREREPEPAPERSPEPEPKRSPKRGRDRGIER